MVDARNTRLALSLARSRLRPLGIGAYVAYSRLLASGKTPVVFLNSIPKSGTHLMANLLDAVPGLRFSGFHVSTVDIGTADMRQDDLERFKTVYAKIRRGQYFSGHLPYSDMLADHLASLDARVIFMYRHPFDVALSAVDFVEKRGNPLFADLFFRQATSHEKRIEIALFGGVDNLTGARVPSVSEQMVRHEGWLASSDVITLRFEELRGDLTHAHAALTRVLTALGADISADRLLAAGGHRRSATMNRGETGRWRTEMPPALVERAQADFGAMLTRWGYADPAQLQA